MLMFGYKVPVKQGRSIMLCCFVRHFSKYEKWRIGNWHITTDTLIAIIKAQNFHEGFETPFIFVQCTK